jgi:hypothetical protein
VADHLPCSGNVGFAECKAVGEPLSCAGSTLWKPFFRIFRHVVGLHVASVLDPLDIPFVDLGISVRPKFEIILLGAGTSSALYCAETFQQTRIRADAAAADSKLRRQFDKAGRPRWITKKPMIRPAMRGSPSASLASPIYAMNSSDAKSTAQPDPYPPCRLIWAFTSFRLEQFPVKWTPVRVTKSR